MAYQIWLGNPYEMHYDWQQLCLEVESLFTPVIERHDSKHKRKLDTVRCTSRFTRPAIGPTDLIVYVVPAPSYGFVGVDFGTGGRVDAGGLTLPYGGQVCSEAYVADAVVSSVGVKLRVDRLSLDPPLIDVDQKRDPSLMAKLIYHEALHNRTGYGNRKLHNTSGVSLGQATISPTHAQSKKDIELMASYLLHAKPTQWTGGWAAVDTRFGPRTRTSTPQG